MRSATAVRAQAQAQGGGTEGAGRGLAWPGLAEGQLVSGSPRAHICSNSARQM